MQVYRKIASDIEAEIMSGAWPPGTRIPFEHELMERYGCARMTVSKALSGLAERGLITRRRKAGSIVAIPRVERAVLDIHDFADAASKAGRAYRHRILSRQLSRLGEAEAGRLGLPAGVDMLHLVTLHLTDGEVEAYEDRLINLGGVPEARDEPFDALPPGTWLLQRVPWSEAEHIIRAVMPGRTLRQAMTLPADEPCLELERRTWRSGICLTHARITYAGSRQSLVARFAAATGQP